MEQNLPCNLTSLDEIDNDVSIFSGINLLLAIVLIALASFSLGYWDIKKMNAEIGFFISADITGVSVAWSFWGILKSCVGLKRQQYLINRWVILSILIASGMILISGILPYVSSIFNSRQVPITQEGFISTIQGKLTEYKEKEITTDDVCDRYGSSVGCLKNYADRTAGELLLRHGVKGNDSLAYHSKADSLVKDLAYSMNVHSQAMEKFSTDLDTMFQSQDTLNVYKLLSDRHLNPYIKVLTEKNGQLSYKNILKDYLIDVMQGNREKYKKIKPLPFQDGHLIVNELIIVE